MIIVLYYSITQLKDLGNLFSEIQTIKKTGDIFAGSIDILKKSFKNMTGAQIIAKTSSMGLSESLQIELAAAYATDKENYANVTSLSALSASQTTTTATTTGLSTAFKGLWATLKANPIFLVIGAAALGVTVWSKYRQHVKETRQANAEAADTYKETTVSIDDYISKYQELRQALIAAKGNEQETYDVKRQLLELQTELNEAYGDEYGRLDLVTDAYKDQTNAIKAYNKEAANELLNEIGEKGIKDTKNQMLAEKRYNLSSAGISLYSDEGLAIQELAEKYGININTDESSGTFNLV